MTNPHPLTGFSMPIELAESVPEAARRRGPDFSAKKGTPRSQVGHHGTPEGLLMRIGNKRRKFRRSIRHTCMRRRSHESRGIELYEPNMTSGSTSKEARISRNTELV